ncbi:site-specific integrase [Sinorhizobium fredii]|uniref:Integrase family protein n=1 Tax=Rhizobium fredii TaxID=380 RepID=A0A2L0H8L8_RHIFR|nr:hypothetical protein [Sinorhizobium fredii]AUX77818.1 integrase family protein [Sinorhizobium fredii]
MSVSKTAVEARKLALAAGKRIEKPIPKHSGLYIVSQPTGAQSWAYRYRRPTDGRQAKLTLGPLSTYAPGDEGYAGPEEPTFGDPLDVDAAWGLVQECQKMLRRKIDPGETVKQMKAGGEEIILSAATDGWTFEALLMKFIDWYQPNRETTKRQTAYWLGLKPDGRGGWEHTGNGILGKWKGRVFSRYDGTPVMTAVDANEAMSSLTKVSRNRTRSALKVFSGWASEFGQNGRPYVAIDPFAGMKRKRQDREKPGGEQGVRVLEDWEIAALWKAVMAEPDAYGLGALLILTTAQRPEMTFEARYEHMDFAEREWRIPAEHSKVDRPHRVPLSEMALWIIAQLPTTSGYLFQPKGSGKRPLNKHTRPKDRLRDGADKVAREAGRPSLEHWTYKHLQKTAITHMERPPLRVPPHVTKAVQQHSQGTRTDQAYRGYEYDEEKHEALEKWGKQLAKITS